MADQSSFRMSSIQKRAFVLVLPLVNAAMLSIGFICFHILNKQSNKRSERFLQDRQILTISEDQKVRVLATKLSQRGKFLSLSFCTYCPCFNPIHSKDSTCLTYFGVIVLICPNLISRACLIRGKVYDVAVKIILIMELGSGGKF